jgi:hypothetical protein
MVSSALEVEVTEADLATLRVWHRTAAALLVFPDVWREVLEADWRPEKGIARASLSIPRELALEFSTFIRTRGTVNLHTPEAALRTQGLALVRLAVAIDRAVAGTD